MIIFGSRGITLNHSAGEFACPGCGGQPRDYARKTVRRFFTLYFIPLIPLDKVGEFVECRTCGHTFDVAVLDFDPEAQQEQLQSEFATNLRRTMILAAVLHGDASEPQVETIRDLCGKLGSGSEVPSRGELNREINLARKASSGVGNYVARFGDPLNEHGKEMVLKAVLAVVSAGVEIEEKEMRMLGEVAAALKMSPAHFRGILAEMSE